MKAVIAQYTPSQRVRTGTRMLLAASAVIGALLSSGCYGPAKGPTDPKEFIVQGKQWTSTSVPPSATPSIDPSAPATTP